jgi:hypothetical protein
VGIHPTAGRGIRHPADGPARARTGEKNSHLPARSRRVARAIRCRLPHAPREGNWPFIHSAYRFTTPDQPEGRRGRRIR